VFTTREWEAFQKEMAGFAFGEGGLGVWEELDEAAVTDGASVLVSFPFGIVVKAPAFKAPAAEVAVASGDIPTIARAARSGADAFVALLEEAVAKAKAAGTFEGERAELVDRVLRSRLSNWEKIRLVFKGSYLSRGNKLMGIKKKSMHSFSFAYPTWADMLEFLGPQWRVARFDLRHWFYSAAPYLPEAMPYLIARARNPHTQRVHYYRPHRLVMGVTDAPGIGQSAGTLIAKVAEGLAAEVGVDLRTAVVQDDCVAKVPEQHVEAATHILATNMLNASTTPQSLEAVPKRRGFDSKQLVTGVEMDLGKGQLSLPLDSVFKYLERSITLSQLLQHKDPDIRSLVSTTMVAATVGSLGWWAQSTNQGPAHLSPLYPLQSSLRHLDQHTPAAVQALGWWEEQALAGKLRPQPIMGLHGGNRARVQTSDASAKGLAAVCGSKATFRPLVGREVGPAYRGGPGSSSFYRELAAAAMGLVTFGQDLQGTEDTPTLVLTLCDNASGGDALAKGNIHANGGHWGRVMFQAAEDHHFHFFPLHYPRELNAVADKLAGAESWEEFCGMCATMGLTPVHPAVSSLPPEGMW
jgi:hypothetical protein